MLNKGKSPISRILRLSKLTTSVTHQQLIPFNLHLIGCDALSTPISPVSTSYIKLKIMPWAGNHPAFDLSFDQGTSLMGANIIQCKKPSFDMKDSH